jgi:hypothetical protein
LIKLWHKLKESVFAVAPVAVLVTVLALFVVDGFSLDMLWSFLIGTVMVIVGMALFQLGADTAMMPIGEHLGQQVTKTKKLGLVMVLSLMLGFAITVAEPDLWVLGGQLASAINMYILIVVVAVGVGIFLVIAMLRVIFQWSLRRLFLILYAVVFALAVILVLTEKGIFLPVAFDSGGVTTGPMTVPFIMAFGIGVAAMKGGGKEEDNFGMIALCSVGPIIAVMLLGLAFDTSSIQYQSSITREVDLLGFLTRMPDYMQEVLIAIGPIFGIFLVFNFLKLKLSKLQLGRISIGALYAFIGLVIFLTGVSVGFMPAANVLGQEIAALEYNWILIPIGTVVGFFIVMAEPAVHVLTEQVETISNGKIKKRTMFLALMGGVGVSVGLAMIRVLTSLNVLWFLIPGYVIALGLTFFVPKVYTAIAFDSGGVASGPMASTFLLTFAIGASIVVVGNSTVMADAFGVVAMVAMTPLIAVQIVGLIAKIKGKTAIKELGVSSDAVIPEEDAEIIELD